MCISEKDISGVETEKEAYNSTWTLDLLRQLSNLEGHVEKLADPCIIKPLVSYITRVNNIKARHILEQIVR